MSEQLYKVTNYYTDPKTKKPTSIFRRWNLTLLNEEEKKAWEAYKLTEGYLGPKDDVKSQNMRKRMREADKLEEWVNEERMGTIREIPIIMGDKEATVRRFTQYQFELKPNLPYIMTELQATNFRAVEKIAVPQTLELGQTKEDIHYSGYVTIEEHNPEVAENEVPEKTESIALDFMGKKELQLRGGELGITFKFGSTLESMRQLIRARLDSIEAEKQND
jgi:hypothetical protein